MLASLLQVDMYRDMWERAMDEGLEMLLQVNTEDAYYVGSAQVPKLGLKATFSPKVGIHAPAAHKDCARRPSLLPWCPS